MKKSLNKFTRGYVLLFGLKLIFLGSIITLNSCQTENSTPYGEIEILKENLRNSLFENQKQFESIIKPDSEIQNTLSRANDYKDLNISETEAMRLLGVILKNSKNLLSYYGITEKELIKQYGTSDDHRIILAAIGAMVADDLKKQNSSSQNYSLFSQKLYAQTDNLYADCALEVLGLNFGVGTLHDLAQEGIEKVVRNLVKKTALRLLGPVGIAITVAHYMWCITHTE